MTLLLSLCAAASYTFGGVCMKLSDGFTRPIPSIALFGLFFLGAGLQTLVTQKNELAISYIVVLGLEAVLALAFGVFIFREGLSAFKLIGFALVVCGVGFLRSA
jgi:small multidrug resistance pump